MIIEIKQPIKLSGLNIVLGDNIQILGRTEEGASSLFDRLSQFDLTKSPKFIRIWGSRTENFTYFISVDNYLPFSVSDIKGVQVPRNYVMPIWDVEQPLTNLLSSNDSIGAAVILQSVKSNEELVVATYVTFSYIENGFKHAVLGDEITIPKSRLDNSSVPVRAEDLLFDN